MSANVNSHIFANTMSNSKNIKTKIWIIFPLIVIFALCGWGNTGQIPIKITQNFN